jgi:hypothetical protein
MLNLLVLALGVLNIVMFAYGHSLPNLLAGIFALAVFLVTYVR